MFDVSKFSSTITSTVTETTNAVAERLGDITKLDLTRLDVSKLDLPEFDLPEFDLPKFDLPRFEMPAADLPAEVDRVANVVRDATYAGIGAVVIAAQLVDSRIRKLAAEIG